MIPSGNNLTTICFITATLLLLLLLLLVISDFLFLSVFTNYIIMYEDTATAEIYPCFVKVSDDEQSEENVMELPTEKDGTIILSTVQAQFPSALGLKYKSSATGAWRGIRLSDNVLDPPFEGWGSAVYYITIPKTGKNVSLAYSYCLFLILRESILVILRC